MNGAERKRRWRLAYPERAKSLDRRIALTQYGLTLDSYEALLEAQAGLCAVCTLVLPPGDRHVDHDHHTGKVRGITHNKCNASMGLSGDSSVNMFLASQYLMVHDNG